MKNTTEKDTNFTNGSKKQNIWWKVADALRWISVVLIGITLTYSINVYVSMDMWCAGMWIMAAGLLIEFILVFATTNFMQSINRKLFACMRWTFKFSLFLIRRFFIIALSILLLGGLYFCAPWKVLALIGVLLALMTVVPKKKRKYGWIAVGLLIVCTAIWIFIPEKDSEGWSTYTFDDEAAAYNIRYEVPEEENAAKFYDQIKLTDFYENSDEWDKWEDRGPDLWDPNDETLRRAWKSEEFPEMAEWLETEKVKMAPFFEAVKYDKCWFKISSDPDELVFSAGRYGNYRMSNRIITRMIYNDFGEGKIQDAIDKTISLFKFSNHIQQQCGMLDELISWIIYSSACVMANEILINYSVNEEQMRMLEENENIFEYDWQKFVTRVVDYEKLYSKAIAGLFYEVNENGKVRFARRQDYFLDFSLRYMMIVDREYEKTSRYRLGVINKFERLLWKITYNKSPEELAAIINNYYNEYQKKLIGGDFEQRMPEKWQDILKYNLRIESFVESCINYSMYSFGRLNMLYNNTENLKNTSFIIAELRQYKNENGNWPDSLEYIRERLPDNVFIDVNTGKEFAYKHFEDKGTFILYGFGENETDDGGRRWYNYEKEINFDDMLFWPNTQEELEQILGLEESEEAKVLSAN